MSSFVGKENLPPVVATCVENRGKWRRNTHIQNSAERHSRMYAKNFRGKQISGLVFKVFTKKIFSGCHVPFALTPLEEHIAQKHTQKCKPSRITKIQSLVFSKA